MELFFGPGSFSALNEEYVWVIVLVLLAVFFLI